MTDSPGPTPRVARAVWLLVAAGVVLRLTGLEVHSLWFDEAATLHAALADDPTAVLRLDRHPPLSHLAFRWWAALVGEQDANLRLLPAAISSLALVLFAALAGRLCTSGPRLVATALYALAPLLIWEGQQVRMYPFVELGTIVALLGATSFVARPPRAGWLLAVAGGIALAFGSHYFGALAAAAVLALALTDALQGRLRYAAAAALATAACAGLLVWLPWLLAALPDQLAAPWGFQARVSGRALVETPIRMLLVELDAAPTPLAPLYYGAGAAILLGAGVGAYRALRWPGAAERRAAVLLLAPVAGALLTGLLGPLNFTPKYLIAAVPGLVLLAAQGLLALRPSWLRVAATALVLVVCAGHTLLLRLDNHREDYRAACRELLRAWRPGDRVVAVHGTQEGFSQAPLRHYLRDEPDVLATLVDLAELGEDPELPDGAALHVIYRERPYAAPALRALQQALRTEHSGDSRFDIRYLRLRAP